MATGEIRIDCFGYTPTRGQVAEHCSALDDFYCQKNGKCNFYCHKNNFDKKKMLADIKAYTEKHSTKKEYVPSTEEILETISD